MKPVTARLRMARAKTTLSGMPFFRRRSNAVVLAFVCLIVIPTAAWQGVSTASGASDKNKPGFTAPSETTAIGRRIAVDFLHDQRDIWTSPLKLRRKDLFWVVPSGVVVSGMIYRDVDAYRG